MRRNHKIVYTVRDVPDTIDARVREVAEAEGVSLNAAVIRVLDRGLGGEGSPMRRRDLRSGLEPLAEDDARAWRDVLSGMDTVDPADWK